MSEASGAKGVWARSTGMLIAGAVMSFNAAANAQEEREPFAPGDASLHRKVLATRIDDLLWDRTLAEVFGTVDVALGTTAIVLVAPYRRDEPALLLTYAVGFGAIDVTAVCSLFMTRDTRSRVFQVILPAAPAVANLGIALTHDPYPFPRLTVGSLAGGYFASTLLEAINDFSIPVSFSTLRAHRERLENGEDPSADERRAMHHDMLGARGPIPRWMIAAPVLIAGAVALTPALSDRYSQPEKTWAAVFGGLAMTGSVISLLPDAVTRYENDLKTLNITVALLPGGLGARGTFSAF